VSGQTEFVRPPELAEWLRLVEALRALASPSGVGLPAREARAQARRDVGEFATHLGGDPNA
jgi:hypothetical protein